MNQARPGTAPQNSQRSSGEPGQQCERSQPSLNLALRISECFRLPVEAIFSRQPLQPLSTQLYPQAAAKSEAVKKR